MKKVLIVSPHFPPINAPDMQRVRLALPYLRVNGWEPTVLAVAPDCIEGGVRDPLLEQTYPADVQVIRVKGLSPRATRWAGFGNLWFRCGGELRRRRELLAAERFDLVFSAPPSSRRSPLALSGARTFASLTWSITRIPG